MKTYLDLIAQTFDFPTPEFKVNEEKLFFHDVCLLDIVKAYGTPLKLTYLPKIGQNIQKSRQLFEAAMQKHQYQGTYTYCYCTKSSHFSFVVEEALRHGVQIETSSAYDISIVRKLFEKGHVNKQLYIVCNGFKRPLYTEYISQLINDGFENTVPVLDNLNELDYYDAHVNRPYQVGIRLAADEEPNFNFYTSRLGIRYADVEAYAQSRLKGHKYARLKMLHFFINTGIQDTSYYWSELARFTEMYCKLKQQFPELDTVDIGGGFPIKTNLYFDYDYAYMVDQIVENIGQTCKRYDVPVPNLMTEFGSFTVGESGATIYSVLDQKLQNDKELWYMIDGSFITQMPDVWGMNQKFIMLALNHWGNAYHKVNLGGLTCDSMDYYNAESNNFAVWMPRYVQDDPLYVGFFHTGAYQESLGGYGGIQHCLIPAPKHVILDRNAQGQLQTRLFAPEQDAGHMLNVLGY